MRSVVIGALLFAIVGTGVSAQTIPKKAPAKDPNRMVCRTEEVIGSRLQSKKHCMTAIQWDQLEREQRNTVDHIEAYRPTMGQ